MKARIVWKDKMLFEGDAPNLPVTLDAKPPIGSGRGATPKELMVMALCGCTAMDVIALMRKYKQEVESFEVTADAPVTEGHPAVVKEFNLLFSLKGKVEPEKALEAVKLSQTRYCGVSAMLVKAAPIHYRVEVNGVEVGSGDADFSSAT